MTRDFDQKVVVVTGASRGLGRAIAVEFGGRGAFVIVNYRNDRNIGEAEKTLEMVREASGDGRVARADVGDRDQVQAMFKMIHAEHRRVDILINNAGITRDEYFLMMRPQSWKELIDVHLNAVYHCSKAVIRGMCAAKRGVIVNIGSGSALVAMPGQVNYSASKAGLLGFSRSLAREVADKNVRVLHVAPGFFRTDMTEALDPAFIAETHRVTPLGRWGTPEELAGLVRFFASDDASYITGQTITIDGGRGAIESDFGF